MNHMIEKPYMDIELFPCSGGMAEGFRRAGVLFDMAIEIEEQHCDSYEENIGHRPLQMDARSFLSMLIDGWRPPRPVRMLVADPPCTPWSRSGKRLGQDDPRDMLEGTCRIIALLQPQIYLIGNVPGLDDGPNLHIVQRVIGGLSKHGYCTADFARLDAVNYGVPQHRIRPWWFGHRPETPCLQWPEPSHADPDELHSMALPLAGVRVLERWVTCRDALGHLSPQELGRPIRLRRRTQHSKQSGSVPGRPARVVGTSNLSDGNVLLFDDQPRAGKRGGRKRDRDRDGQGNRVGNLDKPSATVTAKAPRKGAGQHAVFTLQPPRGSDGGLGGLNTLDAPAHAIVRNTHGNGSILILNGKHAPTQIDQPAHTVGAKARGNGSSVIQMEPHHPASRMDEPAMTVRAGSGGGANRCLELDGQSPSTNHCSDDSGATVYCSRCGANPCACDEDVRTVTDSQGMRPVDPDKPSPTMTAAQRNGHLMAWNDKHAPASMDEPATTIRGGGEGHSAPPIVITTSSKHPPSPHDAPAMTVRGPDGAGVNRVVEWPWDRPSTTVQNDPRIAPPGHHDEDYAIRSLPGGVVISEKAAAILQGFPLFLVCACGRTVHERQWEPHASSCSSCGEEYRVVPWKFAGKTKKVRFSQLGQAMPSALAHAVGTSVVQQLERSKDNSHGVIAVEGSLPSRRKQDAGGSRSSKARGLRGRKGVRDLDDANGAQANRPLGGEGPDVEVALPAES